MAKNNHLPVPYKKQLEMLEIVRDLKKKVECGEISAVVCVLARTDGKKELITSPVPLTDLSAMTCMLQAHTTALWNEPDEEEEQPF